MWRPTFGAFANGNRLGIEIPVGRSLGLGGLGPERVRHGAIRRRPVTIPQLGFVLLLAVAVIDPRETMENLSATEGLIAACAKVFGQRHRLGQTRASAPVLSVVVNARAGRCHARHDRHARGITSRCRAMRIGEQHPALCQSIQMRRMHPAASSHAIDPIIQVINGNKQHIRPIRRRSERRQHEQQVGKKTHNVDGRRIGYLATGDNVEASVS